MNKKDYELITGVIFRSGFIKDKNKTKQEARESILRLVVNDFIGCIKNDNKAFKEEKFKNACGIK